jgi:hypothetical protein
MSTAGGGAAAALTIDVLTNLAGLGSGLAQAEAQVGQAATNMGRKMDAALGPSLGDRIVNGIKGAMSAATVATVIGNVANQFNKEFGARIDFFDAMHNAMRDSIRQIPVAGPAADSIIETFRKYGEEAGIAFAEAFLSNGGNVQSAPRFHPGTATGIGQAMPLISAAMLAPIMAMFPSFAPYFLEQAASIERSVLPSPGVPIGPNEQMISGMRDELAELMARQTLLARQDERSRMIQSRLPMVQGEVQAAFGTFRFGVGGPEQASREVVKIAGQQLQAQDRIKQIIETIGQQFSGGN